jgi:hypothetical protein
MVNSTLESVVAPEDLEREDSSIVIQILFEPIIWMPTSKLDLNVLFVLLGVRRVDFGVFSSGEIIEQVSGLGLRLIQMCFHVIVELFGESIAIINVEDSFVEVDVDSNVKVSPGVIISQLPDDSGDFLSFEKDALGNA